jgi:hypothetical protein
VRRKGRMEKRVASSRVIPMSSRDSNCPCPESLTARQERQGVFEIKQ